MTDGFDATVLGFDSVPFFSAAHAWAGAYETAQDNLTDELLDAAAVWTAINWFRTVRGPDGIVCDMEIGPGNAKFVCAADEEATARKLFIPGNQADSDDHTLVGRFRPEDIIVSGRITTNRWAILYTGGAIKPVVVANRQDPVFVAMTDPSDEHAFTRNLYRYGVDMRFRAFALGWWMGYGSDGSGS
jgi:hypothetical protein